MGEGSPVKHMTEVERINKYLVESFGATLQGKPLWRLVWSDKQFEYRHGTFHEFWNDIFLRSETTTKLRPKYSHVKERWILERYFPSEFTQCAELPEASLAGSYEPIYVFQDKEGNYLAPNLRVVDFFIRMAEKSPRVSQKQREQDIIDELLRREQREVEEIALALGE